MLNDSSTLFYGTAPVFSAVNFPSFFPHKRPEKACDKSVPHHSKLRCQCQNNLEKKLFFLHGKFLTCKNYLELQENAKKCGARYILLWMKVPNISATSPSLNEGKISDKLFDKEQICRMMLFSAQPTVWCRLSLISITAEKESIATKRFDTAYICR